MSISADNDVSLTGVWKLYAIRFLTYSLNREERRMHEALTRGDIIIVENPGESFISGVEVIFRIDAKVINKHFYECLNPDKQGKVLKNNLLVSEYSFYMSPVMAKSTLGVLPIETIQVLGGSKVHLEGVAVMMEREAIGYRGYFHRSANDPSGSNND